MTPTSQTWYQVIDVESSLAGEYSSSEEWVDPRAAGPHVSAYYSRIGSVTGRDTFREPVVLYCFTIFVRAGDLRICRREGNWDDRGRVCLRVLYLIMMYLFHR